VVGHCHGDDSDTADTTFNKDTGLAACIPPPRRHIQKTNIFFLNLHELVSYVVSDSDSLN